MDSCQTDQLFSIRFKKKKKKKKLHNLIQVLVSDSILMAILAKYILLHLLYFAKTHFKNKALSVKT